MSIKPKFDLTSIDHMEIEEDLADADTATLRLRRAKPTLTEWEIVIKGEQASKLARLMMMRLMWQDPT